MTHDEHVASLRAAILDAAPRVHHSDSRQRRAAHRQLERLHARLVAMGGARGATYASELVAAWTAPPVAGHA